MVPLTLPPAPWRVDPDGYPSAPVVLDAAGERICQVWPRTDDRAGGRPETDGVGRAVVALPALLEAVAAGKTAALAAALAGLGLTPRSLPVPEPTPEPDRDEAEPDEVVVCLSCAVYVRVPAGTDPETLYVVGPVRVAAAEESLPWLADMTETESSRVVPDDDYEDDAGEASGPATPEAACTSSSTSGTGRG